MTFDAIALGEHSFHACRPAVHDVRFSPTSLAGSPKADGCAGGAVAFLEVLARLRLAPVEKVTRGVPQAIVATLEQRPE